MAPTAVQHERGPRKPKLAPPAQGDTAPGGEHQQVQAGAALQRQSLYRQRQARRNLTSVAGLAPKRQHQRQSHQAALSSAATAGLVGNVVSRDTMQEGARQSAAAAAGAMFGAHANKLAAAMGRSVSELAAPMSLLQASDHSGRAAGGSALLGMGPYGNCSARHIRCHQPMGPTGYPLGPLQSCAKGPVECEQEANMRGSDSEEIVVDDGHCNQRPLLAAGDKHLQAHELRRTNQMDRTRNHQQPTSGPCTLAGLQPVQDSFIYSQQQQDYPGLAAGLGMEPSAGGLQATGAKSSNQNSLYNSIFTTFLSQLAGGGQPQTMAAPQPQSHPAPLAQPFVAQAQTGSDSYQLQAHILNLLIANGDTSHLRRLPTEAPLSGQPAAAYQKYLMEGQQTQLHQAETGADGGASMDMLYHSHDLCGTAGRPGLTELLAKSQPLETGLCAPINRVSSGTGRGPATCSGASRLPARDYPPHAVVANEPRTSRCDMMLTNLGNAPPCLRVDCCMKNAAAVAPPTTTTTTAATATTSFHRQKARRVQPTALGNQRGQPREGLFDSSPSSLSSDCSASSQALSRHPLSTSTFSSTPQSASTTSFRQQATQQQQAEQLAACQAERHMGHRGGLERARMQMSKTKLLANTGKGSNVTSDVCQSERSAALAAVNDLTSAAFTGRTSSASSSSLSSASSSTSTSPSASSSSPPTSSRSKRDPSARACRQGNSAQAVGYHGKASLSSLAPARVNNFKDINSLITWSSAMPID